MLIIHLPVNEPFENFIFKKKFIKNKKIETIFFFTLILNYKTNFFYLRIFFFVFIEKNKIVIKIFQQLKFNFIRLLNHLSYYCCIY